MNGKTIAVKAILKKNKETTIPLGGRCMDPLFLAGDCAKIYDTQKAIIGGIYLFQLPSGELAVHRLIGREGGKLMMKGDRSRGFEIIPSTDLLGEVTHVKLLGTKGWICIQRAPLSKIISFFSKKIAKDKCIKKNESFIEKKLVSVFRKLILRCGDFLRIQWQKELDNRKK